jgi:hypothetical protein
MKWVAGVAIGSLDEVKRNRGLTLWLPSISLCFIEAMVPT